MAIIENAKNLVFQSEDDKGFFFLRITKSYPIQLKVGRLKDFTGASDESDSCNVSANELEEIQELINRALIHFR